MLSVSSSSPELPGRFPLPARCALLWMSLWLELIGCCPVAHAQQAGSLNAAFAAGYGVDGVVNTLAVQTDGRTLAGGQFSHVNGVAYDKLARLNVDGTPDGAFMAPALAGDYSFVTVEVLALAIQPDGRLLVAGTFTQIAGKTQKYLVRLNPDGAMDPSFAPTFIAQSATVRAFSAGVYAVAVQPDGKIVAAGSFDLVDGQSRRGVVRLNADGSLDTSFDPATPAHVYPAQGLDTDASILALGPSGDVYVAGPFRTINGISRPNLARLRGADGNVDPSFVPALGTTSPSVTALACQPDGRLLVAGYFVQPAADSRGDLARFNMDGSADVAFSRMHGNQDVFDSSEIQSITVHPPDGSILIAGRSLHLGGRAVGAIGRYLADGRMDKSFYSGLDPLAAGGAEASISAVAVRAVGTVLVGGDFDTVDGQFSHHLAGLLGSPRADCPVVNVRAQTPQVIVAGGSGSSVQDGKLVLKIAARAASALSVDYSVSGPGAAWVAPGTFSAGALTIPANGRKAKLRVPPGVAAIYAVGHGKNIKFRVEAGRGYVVGASDTAKLRIEIDDAAGD